MKNINKDLILITFLISVILFFNLSITFELMYGSELIGERGCGFPFIWIMDHLGTSLYYVIDISHLLIDFLLIYTICFTAFILIIRKPFKIKENRLFSIIVSIPAFISFAPFALIFIAFSEYFAIDDFEPAYNTVKLYFNIFFPI